MEIRGSEEIIGIQLKSRKEKDAWWSRADIKKGVLESQKIR